VRELHPEIKTYTSDALPTAYEHQIRSFIRMEWWDSYQYDLNPPLGNPDYQPLNFVMVEGDCLYGALKVNQKLVEHQGQTYVCYGLGGVFVYPAFRKRGYGAWLVNEATTYIQHQADADIAVLWTLKHNIAFYERNQWEYISQIRMMLGDPTVPYQSTDFVMMQFVSDQAQSNRQQFIDSPIYFGKRGW